MAYTPTIWADGVTPVNAVNMNKLEQGLAAAVGIPADVVVSPSTAHLIRNRLNGADTQPAFRLLADGKHEWGAGGSAAPDLTLYRFGTTTLGMKGSLVVEAPPTDALPAVGRILLDVSGGWAYPVLTGDGTGMAFAAGGTNQQGSWEVYTASDVEGFTVFRKTGGTGPTGDLYRFTQGGIKFSAGGGLTGAAATAGFDTTLRRAGAGALQVDGNWYVNGSVFWTNAITDLEREPNTRAIEIYGAADTGASRLEIWGDGLMKWGPGVTTGPDVTLYRYAVGTLKVGGVLLADKLGVQLGTANQILTEADGRIYFGSGADVNLYRAGANVLGTDDTFQAAGGIGATGNITTSGFFFTGGQSAVGYAYVARRLADTGNRLEIFNEGTINWGDGTAAPDTTLHRLSAGSLQTDGGFSALGPIAVDRGGTGAPLYFGSASDVNLSRAGAGALALQGALLWIANRPNPGDTAFQTGTPTGLGFFFSAVGTMNWAAPGSGADVNLYRSSADILKTDDHFYAGFDIYANQGLATQVRIGNSSSKASVGFGSALDTIITRESAGVLAINGVPIPAGAIDRVTSAIDITNTTVETTLYSKVIPAGMMGIDRMLRLSLMGTFKHDSTSDSMIVRVKLGGTTIIQDTMGNNSSGSPRWPWTLELWLACTGAANANFGKMLIWTIDPPSSQATIGYGEGAFNGQQRNSFWSTAGRTAIDMSVAQTLTITCQWNVANVNDSWRLEYGSLELV
jgi:hypothetical protein